MRQLYNRVKSTLGSDPWVTASKLYARKRPALFPVRDKLVRDLLDLTRHTNYEVDWQIFRAIMADSDITSALRDLAERPEMAPSTSTPTRSAGSMSSCGWTHAKAHPAEISNPGAHPRRHSLPL